MGGFFVFFECFGVGLGPFLAGGLVAWPKGPVAWPVAWWPGPRGGCQELGQDWVWALGKQGKVTAKQEGNHLQPQDKGHLGNNMSFSFSSAVQCH